MKKVFSVVLLSLLVGSFTSCKKEGCMDPMAANYFPKATTDDGSCSYSTSRMAGEFAYVFNNEDAKAINYFVDISLMNVHGNFDLGMDHLFFQVDWPTRAIFVNASNLPDNTTCRGSIKDKDNFECLVTYDPPGTDDDTTYSYNFVRL
jgi:hypothetical protein